MPGLSVKKFGRTYGLTNGIVEVYISTLMSLPYKNRHFSSTGWFTNVNVWAIKSAQDEYFALPGDSGSLVVTDDGSGTVGLSFGTANNGAYGLIIPMSTVLNELGLTLVGGHGI